MQCNEEQKPTDPQMCVQYGTFPLCVGVDLTRSLLSVQTWSPSPFLQGETPRSRFRAAFELPRPNYTVTHNVAVIADLKKRTSLHRQETTLRFRHHMLETTVISEGVSVCLCKSTGWSYFLYHKKHRCDMHNIYKYIMSLPKTWVKPALFILITVTCVMYFMKLENIEYLDF